MTDEPIDPQDEQLEDEPNDEPSHGLDVQAAAKIARCNKTRIRDAERAVRKMGAKTLKAQEWAGASEFGEFIRARGKERIGLAIQVWAADKLKRRVERVDDTIESISDPELRVRLEENTRGALADMAKIGASLCRDEPAGAGATQQAAPTMPAFPPNVAVQVINNPAPEPAKPLDV